MVVASTEVKKVLDALPLAAFIATGEGNIAYANPVLGEIAGQAALVENNRTLFGLGIFHNPAEYRGFLRSFKHGGATRRLALPDGRLRTTGRSVVLYATQVNWEAETCLCGIVYNLSPASDRQPFAQEPTGNERLMDALDCFVLHLDLGGEIKYANQLLLRELGYATSASLPGLHRLDAENDTAALQLMRLSARDRTEVRYETTFQRKDGTLLPVAVTIKAAGPESVLITARDISDRRKLESERRTQDTEIEKLTIRLKRQSVLSNQKLNGKQAPAIITVSPRYRSVLQRIEQVAPTDSTVLITGETGTGKELIARAIHAQSQRANRPLVTINCAALPAELIESELFGYRKGAFTGAQNDHIGRFELADEGTLFLDEIGEMPLPLQTRLLRVLQDGDFTPLGARESISTNVRIIAATNRNLRETVAKGAFRPDLYFRLNVFPVQSIPLRERPEDIPALALHFIDKYSQAPPGKRPRVRPEDLERLRRYPFEGNVRELENLIQRALIMSDGTTLNLDLDRIAYTGGNIPKPVEEGVMSFEEMQRSYIKRVLALTQGKVSGTGGAAELLGLKAQTLFSKMRKLGIARGGT